MTELSTHEQTQEIILEGLQMGAEANAASMIVFNAKLQMVADQLGIDISEPPLTEVEERNKNAMLESVGKRLMKIMKTSAAIAGAPEPTPAQMADSLEDIKGQLWPDGSITGTQTESNDAPVDEFEGTIFEGAEPVENIFVDDDTTADEDTAIFQSQRGAKTLVVTVADNQDFDDVDLTDIDARNDRWVEIVDHYSEKACEAVGAGLLSEAWAQRVMEECRTVAGFDMEVTSELRLPMPGDIFNGVTQTAAQGENEITINGITSEEQVVEAMVTAFMVTAARYNTLISTALLEQRLQQVGMSA